MFGRRKPESEDPRIAQMQREFNQFLKETNASQQETARRAFEVIGHVRSIYIWAASIVAALAVIGLTLAGLFFGTTRSEIRATVAESKSAANEAAKEARAAASEARIKADAELKSMRDDLERQLAAFKKAVSDDIVTVNTEIMMELTNQFQSERIQSLITEEAQAQIVLHAEDIIRTNVNERLKPLRHETDAKLALVNSNLTGSIETGEELRKLVHQATNALQQIQDSLEFTTTSILADNDSRSAYETLKGIAIEPLHPRREIASLLVRNIALSYFNDDQYAWIVLDWLDSASNRHAWQGHEIVTQWHLLPDHYAVDYIKFVVAHTNITEEQRIAFLHGVYQENSHDSLLAAHRAAKSAAKLLKANYRTPFSYHDLNRAWGAYVRTNHLFDIEKDTNAIYETVLSTDTTRLALVRKLGDVSLVVFSLTNAVTNGSVEGKALNYKNSVLIDLSILDSHLNLVTAPLRGWDTNQLIKFSFKFRPSDAEAQTTELPVMAIQFIRDNGTFDRDAIMEALKDTRPELPDQ